MTHIAPNRRQSPWTWNVGGHRCGVAGLKATPLALCLLLALAAAGARVARAADTCTPPTADPASQTSQRLLEALQAINGVPGMGAAVWREGRVVWVGCAGLRDVEADLPVGRDTVFRFASVSKLLAVTAAARLAQQGRLDLEAPVQSTLPWLNPSWAPMSVQQLSAHIGGLPHYQAQDAGRGGEHYADGRAAVGVFMDRPLLSPPGTVYRYSSWGYTLIGAAIEAASGQHFLDYVAAEVTPGLRILADPDGQGDKVSRLYEAGKTARRVKRPHDFSYTWGGGGMAGTAEDLALFGGRLLRGEVVSAARWHQMLQPTRLASGQPVRDRDDDVGLGWRVGTDEDGAKIAHHAGVTEGARSALVVWPDQATSASVLSNASWVSSIQETAIVLAAPHRPRPPQPDVVPCPLDATGYDGMLDGKAITGWLRFRLEQGLCIGDLQTTSPAWKSQFATAARPLGNSLRLIALDADGSLHRAALVTPHGLYALRSSATGGWSARLAGKNLEIQVRRGPVSLPTTPRNGGPT